MQSFEIEIFFEKGLFSNYIAISSYRTGWCGKKNRFLRFGASSKGISTAGYKLSKASWKA